MDSPMEDTSEVRDRLTEAWGSVIRRTIDTGYPPAAVVETMASVAVARWAELHGNLEVSNYLRLMADQIAQNVHDQADALINGNAKPAEEA
ncbi:hypothetical protein SAMN05216548_102353 [Faunimonas pinastri]|uniref:Uncharacterized protein n=1 Tax=Faunimonas pinastri TaxID=1855383 RepID=A0A1H9D4Z8_9HYPH|nr:hypothetical protein [Faunimonas pinastri]SEQ08562.1 hypothetical protein SAMN05216548_102353 [Faunimonas pinastri]